MVGENIYHYQQQGDSFADAAIRGTREVSVPIAFSILTNIAAFVPMLFLSGIMGKILWMMPVVVILAFTISWAILFSVRLFPFLPQSTPCGGVCGYSPVASTCRAQLARRVSKVVRVD